MGNNPVSSSDKDGGFVINLIGGVIGGTAGAAFSIYEQMAYEGKGWGDLDYGRVTLSAGVGLVAGVTLNPALAAGISMVGEAGDQYLKDGTITSVGDIAVAGIGAYGFGKLSSFVHSKLIVATGVNAQVGKLVSGMSRFKLNSTTFGKAYLTGNSEQKVQFSKNLLRESLSGYIGGQGSLIIKHNPTMINYMNQLNLLLQRGSQNFYDSYRDAGEVIVYPSHVDYSRVKMQ